MCAQYRIEANREYLERVYGIKLPKDFEPYDRRILPYSEAPVILQKKGIVLLEEMVFSLIPPWSDKPKAFFATHNARLDGLKDVKKKVKGKEVVEEKYQTIYESGLWKGPFTKQRCVVPISGFREPLYWGDLAGHWGLFRSKDHELLSAAAIYSEWTDKKTGEVVPSFAIITDDPYDDVEKNGHHRSPLFLKPDAVEEWISEEKIEGPDAFKFLRKNRLKTKFEIEPQEEMAASWKKRVKEKEEEREFEAKFRKERPKYVAAAKETA